MSQTSRLRTVLVIGANGYVGANLVQHLSLNETIQVLSGVRSKSGIHANGGNVRLVDLSSCDSLDALLSGVDVVVNCSGVSAAECKLNLGSAVSTNVLGTSRLFEAAIKAKVESFVQLSTIHVYGDVVRGVVDEVAHPAPTTPYGAIHYATETILRNASHPDVELVVLRLANAFGGQLGERPGTLGLVVNDLCRQAVMHREIVVKSSGNQFRDFIPMENVVRALEFFCVRKGLEANNELFNLSMGNSVRVRELAARVACLCDQEFGYEPSIVFMSDEPREAFRIEYSNAKIRAVGFEAACSLDDGILSCLRYCQMQRVRGVTNWISPALN